MLGDDTERVASGGPMLLPWAAQPASSSQSARPPHRRVVRFGTDLRLSDDNPAGRSGRCTPTRSRHSRGVIGPTSTTRPNTVRWRERRGLLVPRPTYPVMLRAPVEVASEQDPSATGS